MDADLETVLSDDGVLGVLILLDDQDGLIVSELQSQLPNAPATLTKAATLAEDADLITTIRRREDHGNATRYILTERGQAVKAQITALTLDKTFKAYLHTLDELETKQAELITRCVDDNLNDPRWPPRKDDPREP